ncbi:bifunctional 2-polyprenyl-6-hydroxyphenol methylase/3-demethylubiquinol 3-O-methyltransferase UbiG [Spirosoma sp. KNUC1025]|uniref:class I SAM-dependent methyltransferase n=1 Tax=Spirosoma sp. KNUC1025 TaxID=2894082 RepID=UPI00386B617F|nr:class I SAM-dependent methyltransferase [Spirosoma sp. KNUC1025]
MWEKAATANWTEQEVNFLLNVLECQTGASLLDVPCGFGRHTVALAKRGFTMTGIDISTEFLQKLAAQVEAEQLPVQVIYGDVTTTRFTSSFDGAYCLGNSFGYFEYDGMTDFVRNVSAALKPGARFVINSGMVAESILQHFPETNHYVLDDLIMDIRNTYLIEESCMLTELSYTKGEHTEKHYFKHFVYTLSEIKRILSSYGLRTIAVYNSTEKAAYQLGDQQMYLVAEKR